MSYIQPAIESPYMQPPTTPSPASHGSPRKKKTITRYLKCKAESVRGDFFRPMGRPG